MGTKENRKDFLKKYSFESSKIIKYPKEIEKFFTHRFENIHGAIDGIIFYTNHEIHRDEAKIKNCRTETESKVKKLKEKTLINCVHFFRFTEFLNDSDVEEDCNNMRNGIKIYKQIDIEEVQKIVQDRIDELIRQQKIQVWRAGLFFNRSEEAYFKKSYAYQTNIQEHNSAWWTESLYSSIKYLRELEKSDENAYYDTWVHCKIERERNRQYNGQKSDANVQLLEKAHLEYKQNMAKNKTNIEDKVI